MTGTSLTPPKWRWSILSRALRIGGGWTSRPEGQLADTFPPSQGPSFPKWPWAQPSFSDLACASLHARYLIPVLAESTGAKILNQVKKDFIICRCLSLPFLTTVGCELEAPFHRWGSWALGGNTHPKSSLSKRFAHVLLYISWQSNDNRTWAPGPVSQRTSRAGTQEKGQGSQTFIRPTLQGALYLISTASHLNAPEQSGTHSWSSSED